MTILFHTFGCKVNSSETESMAESVIKNSFTVVKEQEQADIVVVNSCTVTANSDRKMRTFLRRAKNINPGVITVLTGCFPQAYENEAVLLRQNGLVDVLLGNVNKHDIVKYIRRFLESKKVFEEILPHTEGNILEYTLIQGMQNHTRAFMKIEDGCDRYCSYCIVPFARGNIKSLPVEKIREQAKIFAENNYKEIVLTGINLSSYGKGTGSALADAVRAADVDGIERIRLSSLEPDLMTDCIINELSTVEKLCPHFHLSLQSGCDNTLISMGRRYTSAEYMNVLTKIKRAFDDPTFTTDIMVGFPTETDEDFSVSLDFVSSIDFLKCHVFPYSPRPMTEAACFKHLSKSTKEQRVRKMISATDTVRQNVLKSQIGKAADIIVESINSDGYFEGYTRRYIPVLLKGELTPGSLLKARITGIEKGTCVAEII